MRPILRTIGACVALLVPSAASAQDPSGVAVPVQGYRPVASYQMDVSLNPEAHLVSGTERLTFRNTSASPTDELRFHAYYNAWKTDASTWMRRSGRTLPADVPQEDLGWIQVTGARVLSNMFFSADEIMESFSYIQPDDGNPSDQTLFRLLLPHPLPVGAEVVLEIDFTSKVPRTFARTGYIGDYYFIAQWFPKIGVLTDSGWEAHQYFPVEYFADYGTYDVRITLPSEYVVGATGQLLERPRTTAEGTKTWHWHQEMVHDFAWTAWPDYLEFTEPYEFLPGHETEITLLLAPEHKGLKDRYLQAVREGLHYFSEWFGPYPYTTATVVDPAYNSGAGGMEYPTFFTGGAPLLAARGALSPENVTIHEFGHQFWYGLVGNNEVVDAWMDEGFNSYSEARVQDVAYGPDHPTFTFFRFPATLWDVDIPHKWASAPSYRLDARKASMDTPSYLQGDAYRMLAYRKPELMHWTLEGYLGWETYREVLRTYQMRWRARHPSPQDFFDVVEEVSGMDMDWFFDQVYRTAEVLDYAVEAPVERRVEPPHGSLARPQTAPSGGPAWAPQQETPSGAWSSDVTVRRLGGLKIPVEVLVTFEGGQEVLEQWDGRAPSKTFHYERPEQVVRVVVDPAEKLPLDILRMNNSWVRHPDHRGAWKLFLRFLFWLQSLLESFAFIS